MTNNNKILAIASGTLFFGMIIGGGVVHQFFHQQPERMAPNAKEKNTVPTILYWRNPMNASIHADHAMKDNMGMDYIPVYRTSPQSGKNSVSVDPDIRQSLGIRVVPVIRRTFFRTIRTAATVTFDEHQIREVTTRFPGWIRELSVRAPGDKIRKGDLLARIYSPELAISESEATIALQAFRSDPGSLDDQKIWQAAKDRLRLLGVADSEIARLERTGKPDSIIPVISPYTGVVTVISAHVGGAISPEKPLLTLADMSKVWVDVALYTSQLSWVKKGLMVTLRVPSMPSRIYRGKVEFVNPSVGDQSRTVKARVVLQNPGGFLRSGMYLEALMHTAPHPNAMLIPREALIRTGRKTVVITELGQGRFRPARVTIGLRSLHWVQVLSGLDEGDQVVTSGQFLLDSESRFESVSDRMDKGGQP